MERGTDTCIPCNGTPGGTGPYAWLTPNKPGKYTLLSRAKAASGRVQPDPHDPNRSSYAIEHPLPIEVYVGD